MKKSALRLSIEGVRCNVGVWRKGEEVSFDSRLYISLPERRRYLYIFMTEWLGQGGGGGRSQRRDSVGWGGVDASEREAGGGGTGHREGSPLMSSPLQSRQSYSTPSARRRRGGAGDQDGTPTRRVTRSMARRRTRGAAGAAGGDGGDGDSGDDGDGNGDSDGSYDDTSHISHRGGAETVRPSGTPLRRGRGGGNGQGQGRRGNSVSGLVETLSGMDAASLEQVREACDRLLDGQSGHFY